MSHSLFTELAEIVRAPFFDGGHVETPAKGSGDPLDLARFLGMGHVAEITTTIEPGEGVTYLSIFADDVEIAKIDILHPEIVECGACNDDDEIEHCSPKCEPEIHTGYELDTHKPSWCHNSGATWFRTKWN
jgi:hypothetical protein